MDNDIGLHILVVDDSADDRTVIRANLRRSKRKFDIAECENGEQAVQYLLDCHLDPARNLPDAMILDLKMPVMDGTETLQRLNDVFGRMPLAVVILTGAFDGDLGRESAREAMHLGAQDYTTKQLLTYDLLSRAIENACERFQLTQAVHTYEKALKHKDQQFREAAAAPSQPSETPRILLVEDYEPNIFVAQMFLEDFGFSCDVAHNGNEALTRVRERDYAVILMDVQMPGMNGYATTEAIRKFEEETSRARQVIIGMTANAFESDRLNCLNAGMDDYISKPFDPDQLESMLKSYTKP